MSQTTRLLHGASGRRAVVLPRSPKSTRQARCYCRRLSPHGRARPPTRPTKRSPRPGRRRAAPLFVRVARSSHPARPSLPHSTRPSLPRTRFPVGQSVSARAPTPDTHSLPCWGWSRARNGTPSKPRGCNPWAWGPVIALQPPQGPTKLTTPCLPLIYLYSILYTHHTHSQLPTRHSPLATRHSPLATPHHLRSSVNNSSIGWLSLSLLASATFSATT